MRWNEQEMADFAQQTPEWEGMLNYRPPSKGRGPFAGGSSDPRDRWFRLRANCLFFFRLSQHNGRPPLGSEPLGVLILERFHVQKEGFENLKAFSIIFTDDPGRRHFFVADSERSVNQWESALKKASYQKLRDHLVSLQIKLTNRTGVDPLRGTVFTNNPVFTISNTPFECPDTDIAADNPQPKPRLKKSRKPSTFQSHVVQNWEAHSPVASQTNAYSLNNNGINGDNDLTKAKKASFKSHIDVPVGNLLDI